LEPVDNSLPSGFKEFFVFLLLDFLRFEVASINIPENVKQIVVILKGRWEALKLVREVPI